MIIKAKDYYRNPIKAIVRNDGTDRTKCVNCIYYQKLTDWF